MKSTKVVLLVLSILLCSSLVLAITINIPGDQPTIQAGIDVAVNADTVLVQPGTYYENINFNGKNITLGSLYLTNQDTTYISQTIINGNQNSSVVTFESGEDSTAVLSGFTVTNGNADDGGGIFCSGSSPSLHNVKIIANTAWLGGGIHCDNFSSPSLDNVTIIGNTAYLGGGIYCGNSSNPNLDNVSITGNILWEQYSSGGGIYIINSSPSLKNVSITDNSAQGTYSSGGGIFCYSSSPSLVNVTITGNSVPGTSSSGAGIYIYDYSSPSLVNCIVSDNTGSGGIICVTSFHPSNATITYSDLWNNENVNYFGCSPGTGCIEENPLFVDPINGDYHLQPNSPCVNTGDPNYPFDPDGTISDMGAYFFDCTQLPLEADFHVSDTLVIVNSPVQFTELANGNPDSWQWDFQNDGIIDSYDQNPSFTYTDIGSFSVFLQIQDSNDSISVCLKQDYVTVLQSKVHNISQNTNYLFIQDAIDNSTNGDTIIVDLGTYVENLNFNGKNITVASLFYTTQDTSYISQTIIDGNQNGSVVTFESGEDSTAVLQGFTIQNGYADQSGGGICCSNNSSPSLNNLKITGNSTSLIYSSRVGGGMYCNNSSPCLEDVEISGNHSLAGGGIYCMDNSNPIIKNSVIRENISENAGGGIYLSNNSSPIFNNVTISGNEAISNSVGNGGGLRLNNGSSPILKNVTIYGNIAGNEGGGIACLNNSSPYIENTTIVSNSANTNGGGIFCSDESSPQINNVIICDNTGNRGIYTIDNSNPTITYSDFWNNESGNFYGCNSGTGCIETDPLFVNSVINDYRLTKYSPCINAGDPNLALDPNGSISDIGAYYYDYSIIANFSCDISEGAFPLTVNFYDSSLVVNPIQLWQWDFQNDGTIDSYLQNPSYTYADTGSYSVSLTVTDINDSTDVLIKQNYINVLEPLVHNITQGTNFGRIQTAIDNATIGDSIIVDPGTFYENIDFAGKNITVASQFLTSNDPTYISQTIIDGNQNSCVVNFDNGESSDAILCGFTITNGNSSYGGGIYCEDSDPGLKNLIISGNNATSGGGGIYIFFSSSSLDNLTITGNNADGDGGGVFSDYCYNLSIVNSIITNNTGSNGLYAMPYSINLEYSNIWNNENSNFGGYGNAGTGCIEADPLFIDFANNDYRLFPNSPCIDSGDPSSPLDPDGTIADMGALYYHPVIEARFIADICSGIYPLNINFTDLSVSQNSILSWHWDFGDEIDTTYTTFTNTISHIYENPGDFSVSLTVTDEIDSTDTELKTDYISISYDGPVWHVSTSGSDSTGYGNVQLPFATIQHAIDASDDDDTIIVDTGFYIENINFNGKNITVGSKYLTTQDTSYISQTIIDGNQNGSVVTFSSGEDTTAVLSGFTITNGYANYGGGIYCYFYSSPSLENVTITNNSATYNGGGICCDYSSPSLENVTITGNSASLGGGIYCYYSSPSLENVTITNNSATYSGGGICCDYSSPSLENVTIKDNSANSRGGGIYCYYSSSPSLENVSITGNSASLGGGIYCYYSSPSLDNVTITNNSATYNGGGICCDYSSSPSLENVTITNNNANSNGGGIYCYNSSSPSLVNSIVSNNTGNYGIYVYSGSPTITYSDFWYNESGNFYGCSPGTGCIETDPLFIDPDNGNYHLSWQNFPIEDSTKSPCIDTGNPDSPFDPDGTISDMGALFFNQNDIYADFIANTTTGYFPLNVEFTDLTGSLLPILSWQWDFQNDGVIDSNEQNPTFTYSEEGSYSVKLTAQNSLNVDIILKENYITLYEFPYVSNHINDLNRTWNYPWYINMSNVFSGGANYLEYSVTENAHIDVEINDYLATFSPETDWYGTEWLEVIATDSLGSSAIDTVKVNVIKINEFLYDFNSNSIPTDWEIVHNGTTTFPWQKMYDNYDSRSRADSSMIVKNEGMFKTANELLVTEVYDFSNSSESELSFWEDFKTNDSTEGIFNYSLDEGVSWLPLYAVNSDTTGYVSLDLSFLSGESSIKFCWEYQSSSSLGDNWWNIDDVYLNFNYISISVPQITGLSIIGWGSDSVTLAWDPLSAEYFSCYEIYYDISATVDTTSSKWSFDMDSNMNNIGCNTTTISGLNEDHYYFTICARDGFDNLGAYSNVTDLGIGFPPIFCDPIPINQPYPALDSLRTVTIGAKIYDSLSNVDLSSIQYRFDADGNGYYNESWNDYGSRSRTRSRSRQDSVNVEMEVTYQTDGDNLRFEWRVKDDVGIDYGYSGLNNEEGIFDDYIVRIDSESPTIINEFICADTTSSTVDLEWSPTTDQHFMQYEIYYSSSNTITLNDSVWNAVNDTTLYNMATTQTTIYGVDNSAEIYFAICAVDSASNRSAFSEVIKNIPVTYPPVSYAPFPVNQPEPEWSTSRNVEIGITFSDFFGVDTTSVQYRIDKNGNSYYDSLDVWNDVYSNTDNNILSSFSENYLESASSEVAPEKIMKSPKDNRSSSANDTLVVRVNVDYEVDSDYLCFEFRAKDINGYGYSYSGENQTPGIDDDYLVRIDATPPDSIDLAQSGYPTDTTLTVAWNTSSDMFFDTYQIYYATHHSITEADMLWDKNDDPLLSDPLQNFSTITGLNSSTTYFFKVRAIDLAGNKGAFSPECYATTSGEQPQIVSDFIGEPLEGGAPLVVQFTDLSTCNLDFSFYNDVGDRHSRNSVADKKVKSNNGRDILTWEWDFDNDGAIDSFVQNPAHTYTDAGIYTVTLIISSEGYSSIETKTDYITVFLQPIHFSTVYQGNGYNNMTFSISEALIGGTDMVSGDEIGIFDGELCVGAAILTGVISADRDILQMVASADDPTTGEIDGFTDGNTIIYRLWDASEVTEITYVLPTYTLGDGTFSQLGTAMVELAGFGYVEQTIGLLAGWNMISFYNEPDNMDMMAIMQGLIDAGELFKVQDEGGLALVELPPPIGWYNGIGDMATTEGYYIKVLADTQLYTVGSPVSLSIEITLLAGWNMMSYPCQNPQNALSVLQPLIDAGVLEKVQNEAGLAIVELPPPIGWYNGIGDFLPGEGYYIKVNANVTLIINCNLESVDCGKVKRESINKVKNQTPQLRETTHFIPIWDNNPYMAMNVFVTSLEIEGLSIEPGDELGIFDGDICVGSAFIEDDELISLIASTDDPLTEEIDGFTEGNEMSFRFWDSSEDTVIELTVTVISGDETFASLGTSVLDLEIMTTGISDDPIPTVTKLDSNYPNPFNPETTINFSIKESGHVTLEIYNIKGQKVKTLVNDVKNAGYHSVVWDGTDDNRNPVSSGIYLYKMNGGNQIMLKKMLLVK